MAFSPGDITKEHILSAVKKIEADRKNDLDLKASLETLERKIEQMY